jgi:hypothetical protein
MADIRINALATTAASTASDDFVAVDGSANGTRKLNAYSPTFGGNLTVSGAANVGNLLTVTGSGTETGVATAKVGASALGGIPRVNLINATNAVNGKYGDIINTAASGNGAFQFRFIDDAITAATAVLSITGRQGATDSFVTAPGTGAHTFGTTNTVTMTNGVLATTGAGTIGGNLTVSGTGTSSVAGNLGVGTTSPDSYAARVLQINDTSVSTSSSIKLTNNTTGATKDDGFDLTVSGSNALLIQRENAYMAFYTNATETMRLFANGNLFVGASPVDSGNGKLQLATHTTSAGGIGFGTDVSLYRYSTNGLKLANTGSTSALYLTNNGATTPAFGIQLTSATAYLFNEANGSIIFGTNNTTALTLDSGQNATFAGKITVSKANAGLDTSVTVNNTDSAANSTSSLILTSVAGSWTIQNNRSGGHLYFKDPATSATQLQINNSTGLATFAGSIAINNTVQTAAGVASTHKVTISIGGTTYYLLATNV